MQARLLLALLLIAAPAPRTLHAQETGGASFVVQRQPAIPLVALRLAILANDPPGYAGAGHLVQHLIYPTLREQAARVGGQVRIERTADAIVYTVMGPTAELTHLADILMDALRPPRADQGQLLVAHRELAEERLAEWETAAHHARAVLRAGVFPRDLSAAGTESSASRITAAVLPDLWAQIYRPERVSVLAVGDVSLPEIRRAFNGLPSAGSRSAAPQRADTASRAPLAPAESTRGWIGVAFPAGDLPPAAVSVATRLLSELVQSRLATSEVAGEHWWTHHGQAVALTVAADAQLLPGAQRVVDTAVATLADQLTARAVRQAGRALRREMLFYSRTPDRMAEVLGRFSDRAGEAGAAESFYRDLDRVAVEDVRKVLTELLSRSPVRSAIPPQRPTPR